MLKIMGVVVVVLAVLGTGAASAFEFVDGRDGFEQMLVEVSRDDAPGFAVLIARGDEVLVRGFAGLAALDPPAPVGSQTHFYAASVAKTMTAAAIMILRSEGSLTLADRLTSFFPEASPELSEIRIYHLLTHTSGLGDHLELAERPDPITNDWVVEYALATPPIFEAGVDFSYSNSAYVLLAEIIEQVSGVSYADFLRERIFDPLGMDHTVVVEGENVRVPDRAVGFTASDEGFALDDYSGIHTTGPGGIYSTAEDLLIWLSASAEGTLLSRRDWDLMQTPPVTLNGNRSWLAMGWSEETFGRKTPQYAGLEVVGSIGSLAGFRSTIAHFPTLDLRVVILSNSGEFPFHTLDVTEHFVAPRQ